MKTNLVLSFSRILTALVCASTALHAQTVSYTGGTLTEHFDGMGAAGTNTPPGWHVGWHSGFPPGTSGAIVRTTNVVVNNGTLGPEGGTAGFNCGTNDASGGINRSLGLGATSTSSPNGTNRFIEVQIRNNSGRILTGMEVGYVGKQWRSSSSAAGQAFTNYFQYGTDGSNYVFPGAAFNFRAPQTAAAGTALNGNLPANYTTNLGGAFTLPVPAAPSATLYLRWLDANDASTDPILAIDDFSFRGLTNPTTVAIAAQPADRVLTAGETATFSVTATGVPVFYRWLKNGMPLSGATSSNYTIAAVTLNDSGAGYSVIASNSVNSVTSRVATLTVYPDRSQTLVSLTSAWWRYNQSGADLGSGWKEPGYNDASWPQGRGVLGLEDNPSVTSLTNTILSLTNSAGQHVITYYFRSRFTVADPANIAYLVCSNLIDDGCIVYLNGAELYRINLTNGPAPATALAATSVEGVFIVTNMPASGLLTEGVNVLAVEAHQTSATSSDVVMGLSVKAVPWDGGPAILVRQPQNQTAPPGGGAAFSAAAAGYPPLSYQWLFNGTDIPGATDSALALDRVPLAGDGFYAVRVSNVYGAVLSQPARLSVDTGGLAAFYSADFEGTAGSEWSDKTTEITPLGLRRFLGQFVNETNRLTLSSLPPHTNVTVALDLFIIRSWNGNTNDGTPGPDFWRLNVAGGPTLLDTTFGSYSEVRQAYPYNYGGDANAVWTGASEITTLGYYDTYYTSWAVDSVYRLSYTFAHSGTSLRLDFSGANLEGTGENESWGLDNVKVFLDGGSASGWPVVLSQPQSQAATLGGNAAFSVAADGGGTLAYRWYKDGVALADNQHRSGATTPTLTITGILPADLGAYTVRVSSSYGSVWSGAAGLTVKPFEFAQIIRSSGPGTVGGPYAATADEQGNLWITGAFNGTEYIAGRWLTNGAASNAWDFYVAKYDVLGEPAWVDQGIVSTGQCWGFGIALDPAGNLFVGGQFQNTMKLGTNTLTGTAANNAFLAKYDPDGQLLWAKKLGSNSKWLGRLTTDRLGNVYFTTENRGTELFGPVPLTSHGDADMCVIKLDNDGNVLWARNGGGAGFDSARGIAVDPQGNVYVSGDSVGTVTFGSATAGGYGDWDIFLAKYDANGTCQWVRVCGGTGHDEGTRLAVDSAGNVYLTGYFSATATFSSQTLVSRGDRDGFLARYSPAGALVWLRQFGGAGEDGGWGLKINSEDLLLMAGTFSGPASFGSVVLPGAGGRDIMLAAYDTSGLPQWIQSAGGSSGEGAEDAAFSGNAAAYFAANFSGAISVGSATLSPQGSDFCIAKLVNPDRFPVVSVPPVSVTAVAGSDAVLSVTATGAGPLSYQWRKDGVNLVNDGNISGANSAVLTIANLGAGDLGGYTVVVSNAFGSASTESAGLTFAPPTVAWARSIPIQGEQYAIETAVDWQGNLFVTGLFRNTADFGETNVTSRGGSDMFLLKYDSEGKLLWARTAGGTGDDYGAGVEADSSGNAIVVGTFRQTAWFNQRVVTSADQADVFVAKYTPEGEVSWVQRGGSSGPSWDQGYKVALDDGGNAYITGHIGGNASFGTHQLLGMGGDDILIAKLDPAGKFLWARSAGGAGFHEQGRAISVDAQGGCYVAGHYVGSATFGATNVPSIDGGQDAFLAKYSSDGAFQWVLTGGSSAEDIIWAAAGASNGCYVVYPYDRNASFGGIPLTAGDSWDALIARYDGDGTAHWTQMIQGGFKYLQYAAADTAENLYVSGSVYGKARFDDAVANETSGPLLVAKFQPSGQSEWLWQAGAPASDAYVRSICIDKTGDLYAAGLFNGTMDLGTASFTSRATNELFILKLKSGASVPPLVCAVSNLMANAGLIHLHITGGRPAPVVLESSSDLRQWNATATNTPVGGAANFSVPAGANEQRFFRARQ